MKYNEVLNYYGASKHGAPHHGLYKYPVFVFIPEEGEQHTIPDFYMGGI